MNRLFLSLLLGLIAATSVHSALAADGAEIMRRIRDPRAGVIVVAHRGCHTPAPYHGWGATPENSAAALDRCVALGVDVMETDVRRTLDGYLVMIHDDSVDRTTNGRGKVKALTLAQLKALRLRQNEGGADQPLTDQTILTLDEILARARGRIVLNLDVKDAIYAEVIAAVERAGARDGVIVKTVAGQGSPPLAAIAPYDRVPFAVIPMSGAADAADLPAVIAAQMMGAPRPVAFELPMLPEASLSPIAARTRALGVRLWVNTLFEGFVTGGFSDMDALRDPDAVWGRLCRAGVSIFQTDEPEALRRFLAGRGGGCGG